MDSFNIIKVWNNNEMAHTVLYTKKLKASRQNRVLLSSEANRIFKLRFFIKRILANSDEKIQHQKILKSKLFDITKFA